MLATLPRAVETREARIVIETSDHRIVGTLQLPRDGYRSRLTDYLNSTERDFIALTDVELAPRAGGSPARLPFVAVARRQIVLAMDEPDAA